jgi:uncharacterized protein YoxC
MKVEWNKFKDKFPWTNDFKDEQGIYVSDFYETNEAYYIYSCEEFFEIDEDKITDLWTHWAYIPSPANLYNISSTTEIPDKNINIANNNMLLHKQEKVIKDLQKHIRILERHFSNVRESQTKKINELDEKLEKISDLVNLNNIKFENTFLGLMQSKLNIMEFLSADKSKFHTRS